MGTEVNISSNTLFHFTNKPEYLIEIIKGGFKPRFCLEEEMIINLLFPEYDKYSEKATPMICYCDLPLSKIISHLEFYGSYGIGLSKNWAYKNGISPINYIYKGSNLFKYLGKLSKTIWENLSGEMKEALNGDNANNFKFYEHPIFIVQEMASFLKPIEGKMYRNGKYLEKRFYDEREWRYVPIIKNLKNQYRLSKDEFSDKVKLAQANSVLGDTNTLSFLADDIKYLIVAKYNEIESLSDTIDTLNNSYLKKEIKLLKTKIISTEQIREDF